MQAYLESDEETIKEHCSPEMIERLTGIMRVQKQQVRVQGWLVACKPNACVQRSALEEQRARSVPCMPRLVCG